MYQPSQTHRVINSCTSYLLLDWTNSIFRANRFTALGDIYRRNSLEINSSSSKIDKFIPKMPSFNKLY